MTPAEIVDAGIRAMQVVVVPVISYGAWVLKDIRDQLRAMNGRLLTMEQWRADHDKQDDHRHDTVQRDVDRLRERVFDLRGMP